MNYLDRIIAHLKHQVVRKRYGRVYDRFKDFTLIPRECFIDNLILSQRASSVPGCVVECGVWKGGMSAGLVQTLGPQRTYFLFDSFEGLPKAQAVDGPAATAWQGDTASPYFYDNCKAEVEIADLAMKRSGAKAYRLVKGWFNETLPDFELPEPIALLRLDGDWYESTMTCLESLFDRVAPKGMIILDDYYCWDGCSRALHDYLSRCSATERIDSFHGVCFIEKKAR